MSLRRGRGIAPLANWTSVIKGQGHGIFINQSPSETNSCNSPTFRQEYTPRHVQIYDELLAQSRQRKPLANWTSVRLGNNTDRPTVDDISHRQLQWNILNDNNEHGHRQRHNRPSKDTESVEGEPIYSDNDSSTSGVALEDVEWKQIYKWSINYLIYRCV